MAKKETKTKEIKVIEKNLLLEMPVKSIISEYSRNKWIDSGGRVDEFEKELVYIKREFEINPFYENLDKRSIVNAIVNIHLTGLSINPELKLAYLKPYEGKLYFQTSYMGKKELLLRAGIVKDFWAKLVYEKDYFEVQEGSDRKIDHKPNYFDSDRGKIMGGYWCAVYVNGEKPFDVMPKYRIDEIRDKFSEKDSVYWDDSYEEMAKKTILNWGWKSLPKTGIPDNMIKALEIDSELDNKKIKDWQNDNRSDDFQDDDVPSDEEIVFIEDDNKKEMEFKSLD